jgi:group I intron endonuclease
VNKMVQVTDYDWEDSGIYVIRNKINGKEYVGKSKELTKRNRAELNSLKHGDFHNKHLQRSYDKYGPENFEIEVIKRNICPGLLGAHEIIEIAKRGLPDHDLGYNYTWGGEGTNGYKPTEEARKNMSKAQTGKKISKEQRKKQSKTMKRKIASGEIVIWNKGIECPQISESNKGDNNWVKKLSVEEYDEEMEKRSKSHMGQVAWNKDMKCPQLTGENNGMYGVEPWNKGNECPELSQKGENNGRSKVNEDGVRQIKFLKKTTNMTLQQIADSVPNATKNIVAKISAGYTWKDVKIDEDDD